MLTMCQHSFLMRLTVAAVSFVTYIIAGFVQTPVVCASGWHHHDAFGTLAVIKKINEEQAAKAVKNKIRNKKETATVRSFLFHRKKCYD